MERASARQQRSLQLVHVDSLLLPKLNVARTNQCLSIREDDPADSKVWENGHPRNAKFRSKFRLENSDAQEEVSDASLDSGADSSEDGPESQSDFRNSDPSELSKPRESKISSKASVEVVDLTEEKENDYSAINWPLHPEFPVSRGRSVSSSPCDDSGAILRFSPPRTRNPCKMPPTRSSDMKTPPPSPSKSTLSSPTKPERIPATPHRQSLEEFWDAGFVNSWNDKHSPRKKYHSPQKMARVEADENKSILATPQKSPSKGVSKANRSDKEAKKLFDQTKHRLAQTFFDELDSLIADGEISRLAAPTGGVKLIWSKTLQSTAGRAHWRRDVKTGNSSSKDDKHKPSHYRHHASIELAEKVINSKTRLYNTLAHEFCHLANFMISGVKDQPHGTSFKRWGRLVSEAFADRDVEVTTKHAYEITYRYAWICTNVDCRTEYKRQSRSIDPKKHGCGKCKNRLEQTKPVPRGGKNGAATAKDSGISEYQLFVRENYSIVQKQLGDKSPMKDVMKEVGLRYRSRKEDSPKKHQPQDLEATADSTTHFVDLTLDNKEVCEEETGDSVLKALHNHNETNDSISTVSRLLDFLNIANS